MAKKQTRSSDERLTHPILEELGAISAAGEGLFAYLDFDGGGEHR